ncbi:hypothetical protein [Natronolimnohabitans innermongolicus]|uniref:Uncharacterized protein n=1 Tax=Natronolimnohabitans innermongolicus JCM 12255 TaxID=1227499 RepID=L9X1G9_9EURY|nr:hypothetical protein [Natronolimnohabitans innermongolicus]ELY55555.1 hypothetical protein C493_11347 [Natronolimnohabitans innermongolicus JCM 12255]
MDLEIVDELKQPEYTGENRCEPCTILNLAIAAIVGSLIARKTKLGGLLAVGFSIALIYLRGYLVPGTPTLTKRYLPPAVLRWFGKEPEPELASGLGGIDADGTASVADGDASAGAGTDSPLSTDESTADRGEGAATERDSRSESESEPEPESESTPDSEPIDLETYFLEYDVLEPCEDSDDLCLTDEFETVWFEAIETVDEAGIDAADAAEAFDFDLDPETFDLESRGETYLLVAQRGVAGRWPSRAALLADIAASHALAEWTPDWERYGPETKGQVLNGLRMFLETCPTGGEISMGEEVVESCCTSHDVFAVTCEETGERLFEQRLDAVDV